MLNGNQVVTLADPHHRFRHLAPLCIIYSDLMILILMRASLLHDYVISSSRFERGRQFQYTELVAAQFYLVYTVL